MIIYLIGFPGSGKTTVGRKLATRFHYGFIDLDDLITSSTGLSIVEIFAQGEDRFREVEAQALRETESMTDMVVATGGGTPCFYSNMPLMNGSGLTVYLEMSVGALFYRLIRSKSSRPLLSGKTDVELMEYIVTTLGKREEFYKQAKLIVSGENLDPEALAGQIREMIRKEKDF